MAESNPPPFDPQRVFGELVALLRRLDPSVESAKVVYRGVGKGTLPVPLDAVLAFGPPDEPMPVPLTDMDPADAVLAALGTLAPGQWMPGKELAGKIGHGFARLGGHVVRINGSGHDHFAELVPAAELPV